MKQTLCETRYRSKYKYRSDMIKSCIEWLLHRLPQNAITFIDGHHRTELREQGPPAVIKGVMTYVHPKSGFKYYFYYREFPESGQFDLNIDFYITEKSATSL